uniref:Uncharacterized protein n=1 Tax=Oryza meridionalis TaxID=40149 RepID=A0A0E0F4Y7_9ORYZ
MSRWIKREVELPSQTVVRSTGPLAVPTSQAAPYPYGGLWFPLPPTAWLASPQSQAMPGSSAFPPPAAGKTDVHPDIEECDQAPHTLFKQNMAVGISRFKANNFLVSKKDGIKMKLDSYDT